MTHPPAIATPATTPSTLAYRHVVVSYVRSRLEARIRSDAEHSPAQEVEPLRLRAALEVPGRDGFANLRLTATEREVAWLAAADEADSLFGKRTEVRTANDRFANLETNYLLQRLESFTGICLLTSNHESQIDNPGSAGVRSTPDQGVRR